MPLVINSLGGGQTHTNTHTDVRTETISRNQRRAGHRPAHAWFKNCQFLACLLYQNLITIYATAIKSSSLLQTLTDFLL